MASFAEAPSGDKAKGEKIFKTKCAQCHVPEKGGGHKQVRSMCLHNKMSVYHFGAPPLLQFREVHLTGTHVHRVVKPSLPQFAACSELCLGQLPVLRMHKQPPLGTALVVLSRGSCCLISALFFV